MSTLWCIARSAALALVLPLAGPSAASAEPVELPLGSRWYLSLHGVPTVADGSAASKLGAPLHRHGATWDAADGWHRQPAPTSRLTLKFDGGAATLTRGPGADAYARPLSHHHLPHPDWHFDDDPFDDPRLARRRLRQALVGLLRAAGGSDMPSALEFGTSTTRYPQTRFAPFPDGNAISRALGLNQISVRLASSGDGHLVLGRRIGRDAFLMLEPGLGGTGSQARLHYRFAPWIEMRLQAGSTRILELVTVLPLH